MLGVTDELYETMQQRDTRFDGALFIGIVTTGIVCFPSCRSRLPKRENVRVYVSLEEALQAGFRPCKRCKPDNPKRQSPDAEVANLVLEILNSRFSETLTLQSLADELNMSPYHLQRTFKRFTGLSPAKKLQHIRMDHARRLLHTTEATVTEVAEAVGFRSVSHFTATFRRELGVLPKEFRALS